MPSNHYACYVPHEGPQDARILVIGEAPGADEEAQGRPFVGKSGSLLERYFSRLRVPRGEVFFTNLCKFRPVKNEFKRLLGTQVLDEGLREVRDEIESVNPNLIVLLGNWPLYFITGLCGEKNNRPNPGSGIGRWRGSVVPATEQHGSRKCIATFHPSFVLRSWSWHPIFMFDLTRAVVESTYPDIRLPDYDEIIDPVGAEAAELVRELIAAPIVSSDIETFGDRVACVGFADSPSRAVCFTDDNPDGIHEFARAVWEAATPKIFQFATFDGPYMRRNYGWELGGYHSSGTRRVGWDTYIASATLLPEFPRGLDFLCSVYTPFPYYKEERKVWKETNDRERFWRYNCRDNIVTYLTYLKQKVEMEELFKQGRRS